LSSDAIATTETALKVVVTDEGPVTLTSIEYLEQLVRSTQSQLEQLSAQIKTANNQAEAMQARAGWALTRHLNDWSAGERMPRVEAVQGLETLVESLGKDLAEVAARPHHGIGGLIGTVKDKHEAGELEAKLQSAKAELERRYRSIVEQLGPTTGVSEADDLLTQVGQQLAGARGLTAKSQDLTAEMQRLAAEVQQRKDVSARLGFDALGVQANLITNGLQPISTDLVLKAKEIAVASAAATLCRHKTRTQFVGGSQGVSIPLGHGFRYRVSSFRGHPVQTEVLTQLDEGTLVVTNQRLVFLGSKRDVSTPIAKLLQIEPFSNGIGISREGKETRDIYLVDKPAYLVLYMQWVVSHPS
jgi:hypothetical protein